MFEFVELTDGTDATACELTDTLRYALVSYSLQVAALADSELGTDGPYDDSVDQVTFHAIGCTAAEAYANAAAVNALLDQAYRWQRGDAASRVVVRLRAQNSSTLLFGIIKGRAPGGAPNTALPAIWNEHARRFVIENITIQIRRRGRLLRSTTDSVVVSPAAVPTVMSAVLTNHPQVSPVRLDFTGAPASVPAPCIIAISPLLGGSATQVIMEAEGGTLGPNIASVADAANSARGGSVARFTTPLVPVPSALSVVPAGLSPLTRRLVCVMAVRKNQVGTAFDIRAVFQQAAAPSAAGAGTTETIRVSGGVVTPQLIIFDPVSFRNSCDQIAITITPVTAVSGDTFDIDYVAVIAVDDVASTILRVDYPGFAAGATISIDALSTDPVPRVQEIDGATLIGLSYTGAPAAVGMRGTTAQVTIFATGGGAASNRWRMYDTVGAAVAQLGLTLTRDPAYLIPE